jgi:hypothetical protein
VDPLVDRAHVASADALKMGSWSMKTLPSLLWPGLRVVVVGTEPGGEPLRTRKLELIVVSDQLGALVA